MIILTIITYALAFIGVLCIAGAVVIIRAIKRNGRLRDMYDESIETTAANN